MLPPPLRVLFVVPCLSVGGAERHVITLLPEMDETRFAPSLICIGDEGALFPVLQPAGVPATALHLNGTRNIVKALGALVSIMWRTRPDIVVMRGYNAEMLGRIAAVLAGVPKNVVWVHNIGDAERRGIARRIADRVLRPVTSAYFGVAHTQRPYMADELHYPNAKIRIIHNGVDPTLFEWSDDRSALAEFGIASDEPVVGIVAGLRPEKDHATLLFAARAVIDEIPGAQFLVIGDGTLRGQLEKLCGDLGITGNVHFTGNRVDIARLLRALDVFTLSSFTVECFPFALLEAMACGRPAVCTDVGGVGEIVDDGVTGYLVSPRDPQQLSARLIELLKNPSVARQMGRAGRDRLEKRFSLDRSVREAESAFEDLVERRSSARAIDRACGKPPIAE